MGLFYCKSKKRLAQKLRRIILLHFGLELLDLILGKAENPSFTWFSDLLDVTMAPKTNYFQIWRHQITLNSSRKAPSNFCNILFLEIANRKVLEIHVLEVLEKAGCEQILNNPLIFFKNIEYGITIYQNT